MCFNILVTFVQVSPYEIFYPLTHLSLAWVWFDHCIESYVLSQDIDASVQFLRSYYNVCQVYSQIQLGLMALCILL